MVPTEETMNMRGLVKSNKPNNVHNIVLEEQIRAMNSSKSEGMAITADLAHAAGLQRERSPSFKKVLRKTKRNFISNCSSGNEPGIVGQRTPIKLKLPLDSTNGNLSSQMRQPEFKDTPSTAGSSFPIKLKLSDSHQNLRLESEDKFDFVIKIFLRKYNFGKIDLLKMVLQR